MSHNIIKVNAQGADRSGAITQALDDLSDVSITSIAESQALVYSSGSWVNSASPITLGTVFVGEGAAQAYSGSGASGVASGDVVEFYASSVTNTLGATVTSSSNWVSSITLGAGTYRASANVALSFSAAGSVEYQVHQDTAAIGGVGYAAQDDVDCHNPAVAIFTVASGTDVIDVRLVSTGTNINTKASQGNRQAKLGYLIIERIS